jgi:hypothetical protein
VRQQCGVVPRPVAPGRDADYGPHGGARTCWVSGAAQPGQRERRCDLAKGARGRRHIGTLMPRLINQTFAGQDVAKPIIIPTCMRNQKAAELVIS